MFPGLYAPSGVLFAGLVFTLRDICHEKLGSLWTCILIVLGSFLSIILSTPELALASGISFLASEFLDMVIYTPLRKKRWISAVILSNTAGLILDTILFLSIAFGSLDYTLGQIIGKLEMTIVALPFLILMRRRFHIAER